MYEHAGAVRIDHVLGLFRLWWIPQGLGARNGAYVTYNHEAMLGVLAIEATRAGGMVVGEDLARTGLRAPHSADHGVLGTDVEWFNRVDDSPNAGDPYRAPKDYRKQALASVTTHDLPPTAGYLNFAHVKLREELHLLSEPVEAFAASAMAERTAMMNRLVENGYISQTVADDVEGHVQEIVEAMHAMLTRYAVGCCCRQRWVDGVGECRSQNQPGTSREYSNWRVPLADSSGHVVHTDESSTCTRAVPSRRDAPREAVIDSAMGNWSKSASRADLAFPDIHFRFKGWCQVDQRENGGMTLAQSRLHLWFHRQGAP